MENDKPSTNVLKRRKIVLIIAGVSIFLVIAMFSFPFYASFFVRDIEPINDSDLALQKVNIPAEQNAYFDLVKLENVYNFSFEEVELLRSLALGERWDKKTALDFVSKDLETMSHFSQAAQRNSFQLPDFADPTKYTIYSEIADLPLQTATYLHAIQARLLAEDGLYEEALDTSLNSVRIGQLILESNAPLVSYLIAINMKNIGLETFQDIVLKSDLSSNELISHIQALNRFHNNEIGFINAYKIEYQAAIYSIKNITGENKEYYESLFGFPSYISQYNRFYLQPNKTSLKLAEIFRDNISLVGRPCGELVFGEASFPNYNYSFIDFFRPNLLGKFMHQMALSGRLDGSIKKRCQDDLIVASTQAILAIKAFKKDTGSYPSSLLELVPKYLASNPVDPFDNQTLRYSLENQVVYSIGQDLVDSGGSIGDDWRNMPDPSFRFKLE